MFQKRKVIFKKGSSFPKKEAMFQKRKLFFKKGRRFPKKEALFKKRKAFSKKGSCLPKKEGIFQIRKLFSKKGRCFSNKEAVFQKRKLFLKFPLVGNRHCLFLFHPILNIKTSKAIIHKFSSAPPTSSPNCNQPTPHCTGFPNKTPDHIYYRVLHG